MAMGGMPEKIPLNKVSVAAVDIAAANANMAQAGGKALLRPHGKEPLYALLNRWMCAEQIGQITSSQRVYDVHLGSGRVDGHR